MIRVVVADDQKLLRESLKSIIEQDGEICVAGCAENGFEALELCEHLSPDLVLMDIKMPECDGVEGTRLIKERFSHIKVVILTTFEDEESVSRAIKYGADGYIIKDITPEELINVIKNACKGFCVISKKTFGTIVKQFNEPAYSGETKSPLNLNDILKETEQRILRLIAEGKSNKDIAAEICLSEGRVKNIISEMLAKLDLRDRYQLLSFAYKNNLLR